VKFFASPQDRISEDQVSGSLHCGISIQLMTAMGRATSIQKIALDDSIIAQRCHAEDFFDSINEVPHIFTRKSRVQPKEILITSAKRLFQQHRS